MPAPYLAPSLARLRAEINTRWPKRDRSSDGWIGDAAHRATKSEHNPDSRGCVHALDVDVTGIDRALLVKAAIAAPATWYVISNRVIYSRAYGFKPRAYTGANPHTAHVHISINLTVSSENWRGPWLPQGATLTPGSGHGGADPDGRNDPMAWPAVVTRNGQKLSGRTSALIDAAAAAAGIPLSKIVVVQGSWSTRVSASADTHAGGGAFDLRTRDFTIVQREALQWELRRRNVAAWLRGYGNDSMDPHLHGIVRDEPGLSPGARDQVADYKAGRNGLANNGPDPGRRPSVVTPFPMSPEEDDDMLNDADKEKFEQWVANGLAQAAMSSSQFRTHVAAAVWAQRMGRSGPSVHDGLGEIREQVQTLFNRAPGAAAPAVDIAALAKQVGALVVPAVVSALGDRAGLTVADVEAAAERAVRSVLGSVDEPAGGGV